MATASDCMTTDVETVHEDDDVASVLNRLARADFDGFPVVDDDDRLVGIVTQGDLVHLFQPSDRTLWVPIGLPPFLEEVTYSFDISWDELDASVDMVKNAGKKVSKVMTTDVVTVEPDTPLDDVLAILAAEEPDINRVPVLADERIVGIITRQDLLQTLAAERGV